MLRSAFTEVLQHFGCIDAVHNNAGIANPSRPLHETTETKWDDLQCIDVKSVYWTSRFAFDALVASKGAILNTASMVGLIGQTNHAAYVASKGAPLISLTKAMAADYASSSIRVNAICSAGVWTPMLERWCDEQPDPSSIRQYLDDIHHLGACPHGDGYSGCCGPPTFAPVALYYRLHSGQSAGELNWGQDDGEALKLEGTWVAQVTQEDCSLHTPIGTPFLSLLTYNRGGTVTDTTSNPLGSQRCLGMECGAKRAITPSRRITDPLTVCLHLRDVLEILLRLDDRQCMSEALVLDDGSMAHALILVGDPVGKPWALRYPRKQSK